MFDYLFTSKLRIIMVLKLNHKGIYSIIHLTLIYPAHFEDVPGQSGVNHISEG